MAYLFIYFFLQINIKTKKSMVLMNQGLHIIHRKPKKEVLLNLILLGLILDQESEHL